MIQRFQLFIRYIMSLAYVRKMMLSKASPTGSSPILQLCLGDILRGRQSKDALVRVVLIQLETD